MNKRELQEAGWRKFAEAWERKLRPGLWRKGRSGTYYRRRRAAAERGMVAAPIIASQRHRRSL